MATTKPCPHCGGTEFALKMKDGPEVLIWCAHCFRVWFRPHDGDDATVSDPLCPDFLTGAQPTRA